MNKKYRLIYLTVLLTGIWTITGCSGGNRVRKNISIVPGQQTVSPDSAGKIQLELQFCIPKHYVSKRSRLIITPEVFVNDTFLQELTPLVADAPIYKKKAHRKSILEGYEDPYERIKQPDTDPTSQLSLTYQEPFTLPENTKNGYIQAVVSEDGCGTCSGIDTIFLATISLIDPEMKLNWIEPVFTIHPKIREGQGEALLQFIINKYDINLALGNNRREMERMTGTLAPILADTLATLRSLNIYGMASADGPFAFNTTLARNRANSAKQWLIKELHLTPEISNIIQTGSRPEGWWPVYQAMVAGGHPDSLLVKSILTTYTEGNDDVQERYIRRLACWPDIRNNYLQKDRKVEYTYSYTIRSFTTDDELLTMYRTRPDAFNEDELLRVATLTDGDEAKIEVYRTLMNYFPQSQIAANNLAVLYLRQGKPDEARKILDKQKNFSPEMITTQATCYAYADDLERAIELLQDVELPQARYNLGLLKARQRKLAEAYQLLRDYRDLNSAIVALSVGQNQDAQSIMDELNDFSPLAEYVRAILAARANNETAVRKHLENACKDEQLRRRALQEADFEPFQAQPAMNTNH